jgi:phosphonate transport system permease protein
MTARGAEGRLGRNARERRAELERRFPSVFRPSVAQRAIVAALVGAGVALFLIGLWRLDFSAARILNGLGRLGDFVPLMFPPDPQSAQGSISGHWSRRWRSLFSARWAPP